VIFGVRPEHLIINQGGLDATVSLIERTGAETQITANLGATQIVASVRDRINVQPGDAISVTFDLSTVHVFDTRTESRIS
jgi:multiple sugar transport system ATP-binding protein